MVSIDISVRSWSSGEGNVKTGENKRAYIVQKVDNDIQQSLGSLFEAGMRVNVSKQKVIKKAAEI
jgi:hypothetical protein